MVNKGSGSSKQRGNSPRHSEHNAKGSSKNPFGKSPVETFPSKTKNLLENFPLKNSVEKYPLKNHTLPGM